MVTTATLASGLGGAIGGSYDRNNDRLIFVEFSGKVSSINKASTAPSYQVLGTDYNQPEDIVLSADGVHAYVTERSGNLRGVTLSNANRAQATVISSGMNAPQQIALDEAHGYAYIVEYANPGKLWRVNLTNGTKTALLNNLQNAVGVLITSDASTAYIGEQITSRNGEIIEVDLTTLHTQLLVSGLTNPFFLEWADPDETGIITTERDPANRITLIDLSTTPVTTRYLATGVPFRPSDVAIASPDILFLCSDSIISKVTLTPYSSAGPTILGIGFVPFDRINGGFADTTVDPTYFYQVKDSPFGGTLPIMINHQGAYSAGARYYRLIVDATPTGAPPQVEPRQSFSDYLWNSALNTFALTPEGPDANGYYTLRTPGQMWYNNWLGYMLDTSGLTNGQHTITVLFYATNTPPSPTGAYPPPMSTANLMVQIDNTWPTASMDQILEYADNNPSTVGVVVPTCAIVSDHLFTFSITATSPQQHLLSWSLIALWGDNQSKPVDSDSYSPSHVTPTKLWAGISGIVPIHPPPPPRWDASASSDPYYSTHCAHTFRLGVWDRVINGWYYLHYSEYDKSITIWVPS